MNSYKNRSYPAPKKTVVVNNYGGKRYPSNYRRNQPSAGEIAVGLVTCVVAALTVASKALDLAGRK